jgi:hypothetical protein
MITAIERPYVHAADVKIFHLKSVWQYITAKASNIVWKSRHMPFLQLSVLVIRSLTQIDLKLGDLSAWLIKIDQTFFQ